jgi:hypothetical protein
MDRVLADIQTETGGELAIVIASHAHEDHLAGFARGAEMFRRFKITEVWLPWSEKRGDPQARGLRARLAALHSSIELRLAASGDKATQDVLDILSNTSAKRNEPTLANLRAGLGAGARTAYLEAGEIRNDAGGIIGLTARILGPTRDEDFLRRMDPPKAERYPATAIDGSVIDTALRPFADSPALDGGPRLTESQIRDLVAAVEMSPEGLAFALDRATNNLSVVVLFTFRGKNLLFAGDSQYGGWKSWLDRPDAADVLGDVNFYKVAHHGSENATPKSALEQMGSGGLAAMMSTQGSPWPSIPDEGILEALLRKTDNRLFRADSLPIQDAPEGPLVTHPPPGFTIGPFWVDHSIPV